MAFNLQTELLINERGLQRIFGKPVLEKRERARVASVVMAYRC